MTGSGPDGVLRLAAGGLQVALWNDHTYTRGSADNVHACDGRSAIRRLTWR